MKNLKDVLPLLLLLATAFGASAQGLGIRAGVNFQNINGKDFLGESLDNKLVTGFNVGLTAEAPIAPDFYFQPGLLFSTKGTKQESELLGIKATNKLRIGYVEVPLSLLYKPLLGDGHLILGFGPYLGFGVTGKYIVESGGKSVDSDVEFKNSVGENDSDDVFYFKRFDAGANLFFGYEFAGGLSFQVNTQLGLVKINPDYAGFSNDAKWNNTGFGASLGYRFGS